MVARCQQQVQRRFFVKSRLGLRLIKTSRIEFVNRSITVRSICKKKADCVCPVRELLRRDSNIVVEFAALRKYDFE